MIGPDGTSEINDFDPGDVWYFPRGHGHMLQGLGPGETHFVLIFDDGAFSEFGTFSTTDWLGHTPPEVLSKTLWPSRLGFRDVSQGRALHRSGPHSARGSTGPSPGRREDSSPDASLSADVATAAFRFAGGEERRVSALEFPISTTMTGVVLDLKPGGLRELHWHPNADEWQYYVTGKARMTVFGSNGRVRTEDFQQGDAGYVPRGYGHYVENVGDEPLRVLIGFNSGDYQEISLSTWLAANPDAVLADNFKVDDALVAKLPKKRVFIASKDGPDA